MIKDNNFTVSSRFQLKHRGFSLLEIMFVVVIMGLLVGFALPYYQTYVNDIKINKAKQELSVLLSSVRRYYTDNARYPEGLDELLGIYLDEIPQTPWNEEYGYDNYSVFCTIYRKPGRDPYVFRQIYSSVIWGGYENSEPIINYPENSVVLIMGYHDMEFVSGSEDLTPERAWLTIDISRLRMIPGVDSFDAILKFSDVEEVILETGYSGSLENRALDLIHEEVPKFSDRIYHEVGSGPDWATYRLEQPSQYAKFELVVLNTPEHFSGPPSNRPPLSIYLGDKKFVEYLQRGYTFSRYLGETEISD